jgi:ADP-heptose:LPS heptosyltransferase
MRALPERILRAIELRGRGLTLLVIRLGAMGDVLRTLPAVRLLRRGLPEATIHWLVEPPWHLVLARHPDLDGVLEAPRAAWAAAAKRPPAWPALAASLRGFGRTLRGLAPGLVVDFHGNLRSGVLGRWSSAPVRLGYDGHEQKEGNRWLTTHRVASGERRTPRVERNLLLVRALGLADAPLPACELPLVERGREAARTLLHELPGGPPAGLAVIAPGASQRQAYKRPPVDLLAAACRELAERSIRPLVVWGPGEEPEARAVVDAAQGKALLAPRTDLATLAALCSCAHVFVGGDTGPLHLACAVGCPVVGIYGPTDPQVNRPWSGHSRVVAPPGRRYTGIKRLDRASGGFDGSTGDQVRQALAELLTETSRAGAARSTVDSRDAPEK